MKTTGTIDVLIAGAGPTGLVTAAELARRGISCRIVDAERGITDKSKAIGIQARTLEVFENMGIADEFVAKGKKMQAANIFDNGKKIARLSFEKLDSKYHYLLLIPQSDTEQILERHLQCLKIKVERETKLCSFVQGDTGITATIAHADGSEETVQAKWLVGCDGAHSTVRHAMDMTFAGKEYEEGFQLADVKVEWPFANDEIYMSVHNGWLLGIFPLPNGRYRLIMDTEPENAPTHITPTLEQLQTTVNERSKENITLSDPVWMANYRIHRRIVSQLRKGRVFLAGDAAHIHSLAAAQGMNTGIQDVFNLAWKLALVIDGHAPEMLLDTYQEERYPVEQDVLQATDLLLRVMSIHNPVGRAVRDAVMSMAMSFDFVQKTVREKMSEIAIGYENSSIVADYIKTGRPVAGNRMPDFTVIKQPEQKVVRIYELLQTGRYHVVLITEKITEISHEQLQTITDTMESCKGMPITCCFISSEQPAWPVKGCDVVLHDYNQVAYTTLHIKAPALYVVRPDGYIGFRAYVNEAGDLFKTYMKHILLLNC